MKSVAQPTSKGKHRRKFRQTVGCQQQVLPATIPADTQKDLFPQVLPTEKLKALAEQHGALDERRRQLPVELFFWAVILSQGAGKPISLSTVVLALTAAAVMAGIGQAKAVCSRKTVSDNLKERPWQFFQGVYQYLLLTYSTLLAQEAGIAYVHWLQSLLIIDATVIRVANALIQTFPANRTGRRENWGALKMHVAFWLCRGIPEVLSITPQKRHESTIGFLRPVGEDALYLFDLGYWLFKRFDEIIERGQQFVSRVKERSNPLILEVYIGCQEWVGKRLKDIVLVGDEVDLLVNMTGPYPNSPKMRHNVRLVGQLVSSQWHLYITSLLDRGSCSVVLICQVYALRWQIEMLFKNLKSVLQVKNFIATNENGVYIQIYAALILYLLTRIVMLKASRQANVPVEKFSLPKCLTAVAQGLRDSHELLLNGRVADWATIETSLVNLVLAVGIRENPKRKHRLTTVNSCLALAQPP